MTDNSASNSGSSQGARRHGNPLDLSDTEIYKNHWAKGHYHCARCGHVLFDSDAKFNSGTAWPSFRKAEPNAVSTQPDDSFGMHRTELLCANCHLHLGHVFDDGRYCGDIHPQAGERYCILSDALDFKAFP